MIFKDLTDEQEKEFREWARNKYVPLHPINLMWHPVVRNECMKINEDYEKQFKPLKEDPDYDYTDFVQLEKEQQEEEGE